MGHYHLIYWNDSYSVHIKKLDDQHKKLINILHDLQKANGGGIAKYVLKSIFDDLVEFTQYHFESEEELLKENGYPEYEEHKKEHRDLTKQVMDMQEKFILNLSGEVVYLTIDFLSDWINTHLLETDHKYVKFFKDKGLLKTSLTHPEFTYIIEN